MPRTGRPGGNPSLEKYQFTTDREDPLTELMSLRMGILMKAAIKTGCLEDWQEVARQALLQGIEDRLGSNWQKNDEVKVIAAQLFEKQMEKQMEKQKQRKEKENLS